MAKVCPICGQKIGFMAKTKVSDGEICPLCALICDSHSTKTVNEIKRYWETNKERQNVFSPTQKLKSFMGNVVTIDPTNQLFVFGDIAKMQRAPIFYAFSEVDGYKFEVVGQKTVTKKKGGITRALVGGAIAGPVGALVGSSTAKEETQTTGGTQLLKIAFHTHAGKNQVTCSYVPTGFTNFLDDCMAIKERANEQQPTIVNSSADEIIKFKGLLDQGIITQEEFDAKKKQLLGL